jgi:hypothetical protein
MLHFNRNRQHLSSLVGYHDELQLTSYMAKPKKSVLVLSTLHTSTNIAEPGIKPTAILDYNQTKGFVDVNIQMANTFSTRRKCRRWPMTIFFHILDICGLNAYITWIKRNPGWYGTAQGHRRSIFLKELSLSLMKPWMYSRMILQPSGAMKSTVKRAREACGVSSQIDKIQVSAKRIRSKCHLCDHDRRIYSTCNACGKHVCNEHSVIICNDCA